MEFGVRVNSHLYYKFTIDMDNGNVDVIAEFINNEGVKIEPIGHVEWDEIGEVGE